jgi:peroxiredoxin
MISIAKFSKLMFMKNLAISKFTPLLVSIIIGMGFLPFPYVADALVGSEEEKIVEGPLVDERAPDIKLNTLNGEAFQLNQWIGKKPFVMVFFVTWCTRCKGEIPTIKKIHHKYAGEKLGLVTINANFKDSLDKATHYRRENDLPYTILFDEAGQAAESYMVLGVPMILMVDRSGIIRYRSSRFPADVDKAIKSIMQ